MITLNIKTKLISLTDHEQGLATAAQSRSAMEPEFRAAVQLRSTESNTSLNLAEGTLGQMIVKYSEQVVFQPLREIRHWFTYASGAFLEPGYPPLFYNDSNAARCANKSAVAAVGEGIAGFLAQRLYRCRKLARPNHDYPDIVMEGQVQNQTTTFLIESKATLQENASSIEATVEKELPRLASLTTSLKKLDVRPIRGMLIGTALISETEYHCYIVELELV
jgi:hypothetical protein